MKHTLAASSGVAGVRAVARVRSHEISAHSVHAGAGRTLVDFS